ncbi:MAG: permease [Clostridiales bacterium]|nr:permease [Clostridiales bacterium]
MNTDGLSIGFLKLLETWIFNLKGLSLVLFFVFAIIIFGYLIGKINIKGVSLGTAAIFLVALLAGHFKGVAMGNGDTPAAIAGWADSVGKVDTYFKLIQNLGLVLFVTSVGLIAGPTFFKNLKKNALSYVLLGVVIILSGSLVTALITMFVPGMTSAMAVGLMSGALTSTPAFSAAKEALADSPVLSEVAVGHAVAYPFGVIGVVLFVQIIPRVLKVDMAAERKLLAPVGGEDKSKGASGKLFETDKFGLGSFALAIMCGLILGAINIPLGNGTSFSLGATGGPLIMGLIFGHFGKIGKLSLKVDEHLLSIFQELGLVLFLIGAGIEGGADFVVTLQKYGGWLFLWGALMTLVPMLAGFFVAKYVVKLNTLNNLGSITGGMTSTPALGALINTSGTPNVASAYAATYPIALILVVLASQFLTYVPNLFS